MAFSLVNFLTTVTAPATTAVPQVVTNNPFASADIYNKKNNYYGKNNPVKDGYFAGYYNGKPNIVGRKLFIEV